MSVSLQQARSLHEAGDLDEAEAAYARILVDEPASPGILHLLGVLNLQRDRPSAAELFLRQARELAPDDPAIGCDLANALQLQGHFARAIDAYRETLALAPDMAGAWCNLGLALAARGAYGEAITAYKRAIDIDDAYLEARYNLGLAWQETGELDNAIGAYEAALRLDPLDVDVLNNLGNVFYQLGRYPEAIALYQLALQQTPDATVLLENLQLALDKSANTDPAEAESIRERLERDPERWCSIGLAHQRRGHLDAAADAYRRTLGLDPANGTARHLLDALQGANTPRPPEHYIRELFDDYAPRFEEHLVGDLRYQVPALMRWLYHEVLGADARLGAMLDLGCGTGLVGAEFAEIAGRVVGVDLSEEMLAISASKGAYASLHQGELTAWLARDPDQYDLITAADVLVYVGDLADLFAGVAARLRPGGFWMFSVERAGDHETEDSFILRRTGRYAHSREYVRRMAARNGLAIERLGSMEIRRTQTGWEEGDLVMLRKEG